MKKIILLFVGLIVIFSPLTAHSFELIDKQLDLTDHVVGYTALLLLGIAYILVVFEEHIHLHKSKPVLLAAGIIWVLIAIVYQMHDIDGLAKDAIRHDFLEFSELFFFLLVAMTYINALINRSVFDVLRNWLIIKGFSYRELFWIIGVLAFFISPIADNLTTALIMCTVVMTVGYDQPKFVAVTCTNIVVAANAGGAFSPFGDITTLMVWQKGIIPFSGFFQLFIPSLVSFLIPALFMNFSIPRGTPQQPNGEIVAIAKGGWVIALLFILTIITAVCFHNVLDLPPVIGMLMGLGYLKFFSYYQKISFRREYINSVEESDEKIPANQFNVFKHIADIEWDTLFFFYGLIMAVGGLGFIGYLSIVSEFFYGELGATTANILIGGMSAVIDNIPMMYAVLTMKPDMPEVQWLLVTLTAGIGGSLLSIGSAAGVALMGQARGVYTFFSHLKWLPVILLGYFSGIIVHFLLNG